MESRRQLLECISIRLKYNDDDVNDDCIRDKFFAYNDNDNHTISNQNDADNNIKVSIRCPVNGCQLTFSTYYDFELHIPTHTNQCHECSRIYPCQRLLDIHLDEAHSSYFKAASLRKPSFKCLVDGCNIQSLSDQHRYDHLINDHQFPKDVILYHPTRKNIKKKIKSNSTDNENNNVVEMIDDNDSNDICIIKNVKTTIEKSKKLKTCRFYLKASGCRAGEQCIYSHDNTNNTNINNTNINADNDNNNSMDIDELANMFQKNMTIPKISFGRKNRHIGFK